MRDIYFLIGFMGAGKSTLARSVAERLKIAHLDIDELITEHEGKNIPEIFRDEGEDYFRTLESETLDLISAEPMIVATGGGTVCSEENIDKLSNKGYLIYLEAPFELLYKRMKSADTRPLMRRYSKNQLNALFRKRLMYYEQADYHVDATRPLEEVEEHLVELIWMLLTR